MGGAALSARRRAWGYGAAVLAPLLAVPVLAPVARHPQPRQRRGGLPGARRGRRPGRRPRPGAGLGRSGSGAAELLLHPARTTRFVSSDPNNVVALVAFVLVGGLVSWVVDVAERARRRPRPPPSSRPPTASRTALLAAVGHDLRTPLATAKAVVSGLRAEDVELDRSDRQELLETADGALDRLAGLVDNLLDMSRLQAGAMPVQPAPMPVEDVVSRGPRRPRRRRRRRCCSTSRRACPPVLADPGCSSGSSSTSSPTPSGSRRPASRRSSAPAATATAWSSGRRPRPRHPGGRTRPRSSSRSSASATQTPAPGSASGSPWHAAWSRRWTAR